MPSRPKCLHCWDNAYSLQLKVVISCVSRNYLLLCCLHLSTWVWCGYDEKTHDVVHIDMYLVPMFCVWCALLRLCYGHDHIINGRPTISCSGNSILYNQYFCHSLSCLCNAGIGNIQHSTRCAIVWHLISHLANLPSHCPHGWYCVNREMINDEDEQKEAGCHGVYYNLTRPPA